MSNILRILLLLVMLSTSLLLASNISLASTADSVLGGFSNTGGAAGYPVNSDGSPKNEFTKAFPIYATGLAAVLSGVAVILFLYAGWLWMTAQGNDDQIVRAKKIMIGAIIGLSLIIFGRLIAELTISILGDAYQSTQTQ